MLHGAGVIEKKCSQAQNCLQQLFYFRRLVRHLLARVKRKSSILYSEKCSNKSVSIRSSASKLCIPEQHQWKAVGCAYQTYPLKGAPSGCLAVKHWSGPELSTALRESLCVWSAGGLSTLLCSCSSLSFPLFSPWPCLLQHLLTALLPQPHIQRCSHTDPSLFLSYQLQYF